MIIEGVIEKQLHPIPPDDDQASQLARQNSWGKIEKRRPLPIKRGNYWSDRPSKL